MFRFTQVLLAMLLMVTFMLAKDSDDAKRELEKFQGSWKLVGNDEVTLTFKGNEYEFNAGEVEKGKMSFNPGKKPAQVDVEITAGNDAGKKQVGIYEWKDGKVKFCFGPAGSDKRPENFDKTDEEHITFEFEKVKK